MVEAASATNRRSATDVAGLVFLTKLFRRRSTAIVIRPLGRRATIPMLAQYTPAMSLASVISLIFSFAALVASVIANQRTVRASTAGSTLMLVTDVFARRQQPDFAAALSMLRSPNFADGLDPAQGFSGMPTDKQRAAYLVADFCDDLGKLVAHKVVDEDIVLSTYGATTEWTWRVLKPFVHGQRVINQTNFDIYYEFLARRAAERPPARIHQELGLLG